MPTKRTSTAAKSPSTPKAPRTPKTANSTPKMDQSIKILAKKFFHRSYHGRTVGRIEQKAMIGQFLDGSFGQNGLYIAGHPGTGKTAVVTELLSARAPSQHLMINCILKGSVKAVMQSIFKHFKVTSLDQLSQVCIVLDEIDFLAEKDLTVVQSLYSRKAGIKIIGIANTLDLAINKLPNISSPLSFPPYTVHDITAIIAFRLEVANQELNLTVKLLDPLAIELCARKVASTGDLRRALDVIQVAIDNAPNTFTSVLIDMQLLIKTLERVCPSVALSKEARVLEQCNLHQKIILVAIILLRRVQLEARPSLLAIMKEYLRVLTEGRFGEGLGRPDFLDAISNLESLGIAKTSTSSKDSWSQRVSMEADLSALSSAITSSNPLLAALLST